MKIQKDYETPTVDVFYISMEVACMSMEGDSPDYVVEEYVADWV